MKICSVLGRLSQIQEKNIVCMKVLFVSCVGVGACWHFDELFCFLVEVLIYVPYSIAKLGTGWKNLIWRHSHWLLARLSDRQGKCCTTGPCRRSLACWGFQIWFPIWLTQPTPSTLSSFPKRRDNRSIYYLYMSAVRFAKVAALLNELFADFCKGLTFTQSRNCSP